VRLKWLNGVVLLPSAKPGQNDVNAVCLSLYDPVEEHHIVGIDLLI
jgi:hypothetical protein